MKRGLAFLLFWSVLGAGDCEAMLQGGRCRGRGARLPEKTFGANDDSDSDGSSVYDDDPNLPSNWHHLEKGMGTMDLGNGSRAEESARVGWEDREASLYGAQRSPVVPVTTPQNATLSSASASATPASKEPVRVERSVRDLERELVVQEQREKQLKAREAAFKREQAIEAALDDEACSRVCESYAVLRVTIRTYRNFGMTNAPAKLAEAQQFLLVFRQALIDGAYRDGGRQRREFKEDRARAQSLITALNHEIEVVRAKKKASEKYRDLAAQSERRR